MLYSSLLVKEVPHNTWYYAIAGRFWLLSLRNIVWCWLVRVQTSHRDHFLVFLSLCNYVLALEACLSLWVVVIKKKLLFGWANRGYLVVLRVFGRSYIVALTIDFTLSFHHTEWLKAAAWSLTRVEMNGYYKNNCISYMHLSSYRQMKHLITARTLSSASFGYSDT